jgi:hypothetical protein
MMHEVSANSAPVGSTRMLPFSESESFLRGSGLGARADFKQWQVQKGQGACTGKGITRKRYLRLLPGGCYWDGCIRSRLLGFATLSNVAALSSWQEPRFTTSTLANIEMNTAKEKSVEWEIWSHRKNITGPRHGLSPASRAPRLASAQVLTNIL